MVKHTFKRNHLKGPSFNFSGCNMMSSRLRVCRFQCRPNKQGHGTCGREAPHSEWSEEVWKKWNHIFA